MGFAAAFCSCASEGLVECVGIPSAAIGREQPAVVVLPRVYLEEPEARFPVLYLLHGAQGDHWSWVKASPLVSLVRTYRLIVVCPNGGPRGWYVNSPFVKNSAFESHIIKELIPYVDSHYRTIPCREARAIAGYSMGGHGAITLAAKHPELFCSASNLSGILDITRWPGFWGISRVLGAFEQNRELWRANSAMGLAERFAGEARCVKLMIDCGFGDIAYPENLEFHEKLTALGVEHVFKGRPGRHDWCYWSSNLAEHIQFHVRCWSSFNSVDLTGEPAEGSCVR